MGTSKKLSLKVYRHKEEKTKILIFTEQQLI